VEKRPWAKITLRYMLATALAVAAGEGIKWLAAQVWPGNDGKSILFIPVIAVMMTRAVAKPGDLGRSALTQCTGLLVGGGFFTGLGVYWIEPKETAGVVPFSLVLATSWLVAAVVTYWVNPWPYGSLKSLNKRAAEGGDQTLLQGK
jgi:hypothetical protein